MCVPAYLLLSLSRVAIRLAGRSPLHRFRTGSAITTYPVHALLGNKHPPVNAPPLPITAFHCFSVCLSAVDNRTGPCHAFGVTGGAVRVGDWYEYIVMQDERGGGGGDGDCGDDGG